MLLPNRYPPPEFGSRFCVTTIQFVRLHNASTVRPAIPVSERSLIR